MSFIGPLEDRVGLHELVAAYGHAVSQQNAEDWASLWAEDAIWELPDVPGMERIEGKAQVVSAWLAAIDQFPMQINRQYLGSLTVEGNHASGETYTSEIVRDRDGAVAHWCNKYSDSFVKTNGQWRFKQRTVAVIYIGAA